MEPFSITLIALLGLAALIAAGVAIAIWADIRDWAKDSLFPWIKSNLPEIEMAVRDAFSELDNAVVNFRNLVREAWKNLRKYLLHQVVELERQSDGTWTKLVISYIINELDSDTDDVVVKKIETKEKGISYDDLPADVRKEYLKRDQTKKSTTVTEVRDRELATMEMSN